MSQWTRPSFGIKGCCHVDIKFSGVFMKMGTSLSSVSQYHTLFNLLRAQRPQFYLPSHMSHSVQQPGGQITQIIISTIINKYQCISFGFSWGSKIMLQLKKKTLKISVLQNKGLRQTPHKSCTGEVLCLVQALRYRGWRNHHGLEPAWWWQQSERFWKAVHAPPGSGPMSSLLTTPWPQLWSHPHKTVEVQSSSWAWKEKASIVLTTATPWLKQHLISYLHIM